MNELGQIFLIALIQGGTYDFAGWYLWLKERNIYDNWKPYFFRIAKFILDFPVTFYLCYYEFNVALSTLFAFYIFKWCGGCDLFYLIVRILWTKEKLFQAANWFNWTPYGMWEYITGCKIITNHEYLAQCGIGLYIAILITFLI